jgi:hypothetical protein
LALVEKELQQVRNDNQALARYINDRMKKDETQRKGEEVQKKVKEETRRKTMVVARRSDKGQSFKDV